MAVVYRSEKKKIIVSQINLLKQTLSILERAESVLAGGDTDESNQAYKQLLLEETPTEAEWRTAIENNPEIDEVKKEKKLKSLEESFYYRRIINATYYK